MVLQDDPDHLEALLGLGEAQLASRDSVQALATFAAIVGRPDVDQLSPIWSRARQGQGIAELRLGRLEQAHATLSEAATWDPTLWRTWNALGQALDSLGRWSEARTAYEQAMWGAPDPARIHNNLGMSFLHSGDGARAIDHFGTALQLDADLAVAQANLRLALAFEGNYVEALSGVSEKELPDVLNNVGYVALLRGDYPRAEAYFSRALEVSPSFYEPAWKNLQYLSAIRD